MTYSHRFYRRMMIRRHYAEYGGGPYDVPDRDPNPPEERDIEAETDLEMEEADYQYERMGDR